MSWGHRIAAFSVVLALASLGCRRGPTKETPPAPAPSATTAVAPPPPPLAPPTVRIEHARDEREGAMLVVASIGKRRVAFVADEDENAVHTLDLDLRTEIARTEVGARPAQMLVLPSGELAIALRDTASVVLFGAEDATKPLVVRTTLDTADEPIALALSPDGGALFVASGWGHALEKIQLDTHARVATIALGHEPRALAISNDGAHAFVGYATENGIGSVDLAAGKVALLGLGIDPTTVKFMVTSMGKPPACNFDEKTGKCTFSFIPFMSARTFPARVARQTFALVRTREGRVLAPYVLVGPGEASAPTSGYGSGASDFSPTLFDVATVATNGTLEKPDPKDSKAHAPITAPFDDCRLPRAAALDATGTKLAVACLGNDTVQIFDATTTTPARNKTTHVKIAGGPAAVAYDGERIVAFAAFDRTVQVITVPAASDKKNAKPVVQSIALSHVDGKGLSEELAAGRRLFHRADDFRISIDGRACASCHPDGRDDGLVWPTPKGPRQTIFLAGRLARKPPFGWDAQHATLALHVTKTMENLGGNGLPKKELTELTAYLAAMLPPPRKTRPKTDEEEKGKTIFASNQAGCASCHVEANGFTDHAAHDVASKAKGDGQKAFLAPSLRYLNAPYFHDGRFATIGELLRGTNGAMGNTEHLDEEELRALEAYLRSL